MIYNGNVYFRNYTIRAICPQCDKAFVKKDQEREL